MNQALFITIAGMGGVFAFLMLLIGAMKLLAFTVKEDESLDKVAVAIACARRGK
ncbi:MAG: OadG family protein [Alphaproteobacteria bacterium]|nr:OadG family protein [Alphaproteobacteria bacterium]